MKEHQTGDRLDKGSVTLPDRLKQLSPTTAGEEMHALIEELYPICRSITGDGVRETLRRVAKRIPLDIQEVPTGTQVFDWVVPREWNIRDAYIKDERGKKVVDFQNSNLHVVNYSIPVHERMSLDELRKHLYTIPDHPDWIPYRTSYYSESWGFCLSHRQLGQLKEGTYEVVIDSRLEDGHLTYGECRIPGRSDDEVLISATTCHPSQCNDNLSGIAIATRVAEEIARTTPRYTYRFLFAPATIGSITWLSGHEAEIPRIKHGLILANAGDPGKMTYKRSRHGDAEIDRAVLHVLRHSGHEFEVEEFSPWGYDERQFGSPGINLAMGRLTRSPNGRFAEYHTSADNLDFVRPEYLAESFVVALRALAVLEGNGRYLNLKPKGEPQLGRRGLYRKMGGYQELPPEQLALLWVLSLSTGESTLLDIADRSGLDFETVHTAAQGLAATDLLGPTKEATS